MEALKALSFQIDASTREKLLLYEDDGNFEIQSQIAYATPNTKAELIEYIFDGRAYCLFKVSERYSKVLKYSAMQLKANPAIRYKKQTSKMSEIINNQL